MKKPLTRVAFWLLPERKIRKRLFQDIIQLANCFEAPIFLPHVTLYSCPRSSEQAELALLARLGRITKPFSLKVVALQSSHRLTQTLFLKLRQNTEASRLHRALHAGVPSASDYRFGPHLSILYQTISRQERKELLAQVEIPCGQLLFDELRAVAIPESLQRLEDFHDWQPLLSVRLG